MTYPNTTDDFKRIVDDFKATDRYRDPLLFAVGRRVSTRNGVLASVRYPVVNGPGQNTGTAAILMQALDIEPVGVQHIELSFQAVDYILLCYFHPFRGDGKRHDNIRVLDQAREFQNKAHMAGQSVIVSFIFDDIEPQGVEDSTLKLYGLSNRHFKPNQLNLARIFTKLPNVAWTGDTPMDAEEIDSALMSAAFSRTSYAPHMVDKFPLYVHRINAVKMGVRITDQHKVRLGAYLGEGTTLMPGASYINFNAGTDGSSMVEGRISSSAFVGKGTDIGGGASILGTLSGGNAVPISVGRNCLLEVNCALGIPIGDAVIIGAETAVMASSRVLVGIEGHPLFGQTVKAALLSGINAATFRHDDRSGVLEVVRTRRNIEFAKKLEDGQTILSADLHKNN